MDAELCAGIVQEFCAGLPKEIGQQLSGVEILVCETPEHATQTLNEILDTDDGEPATEALPADTKGIFIGEPMEVEDEDGEGEHVIEELADGAIAIVASNLKDADEIVLVLLHEIGHALGLDEEGVKALGLGVSSTSSEAPNDVPAPKDS